MDLYQRHSATTYCTAFSYKPIVDEFSPAVLDTNKILEFPKSYCEKLSGFEPVLEKFTGSGAGGHSSSSRNSISSLAEESENEFDDNQSYNLISIFTKDLIKRVF